jgi:hypothetical protein
MVLLLALIVVLLLVFAALGDLSSGPGTEG